jgi:hypothetical protein
MLKNWLTTLRLVRELLFEMGHEATMSLLLAN